MENNYGWELEVREHCLNIRYKDELVVTEELDKFNDEDVASIFAFCNNPDYQLVEDCCERAESMFDFFNELLLNIL